MWEASAVRGAARGGGGAAAR
eukprot:COSAG02_NODE_13562_length_1378_cov_78.168100_2_plen_20_part_01